MNAAKTKPILFNGDMVRAILDGRKTVARKVVKPVYEGKPYPIWEYPDKLIFERTSIQDFWQIWINKPGSPYTAMHEPYNKGDILWVRETFTEYKNGDHWIYIYKECDKNRQMLEDVRGVQFKWRPPLYLPKEAARIFLRVTNVDVQRLQDMTNDDALKEGFEGIPCECENAYMAGGTLVCTDCRNTGWQEPPIVDFMHTWNQCAGNYERYGWDANPWVWVIEFERIKEDVYERNVGG